MCAGAAGAREEGGEAAGWRSAQRVDVHVDVTDVCKGRKKEGQPSFIWSIKPVLLLWPRHAVANGGFEPLGLSQSLRTLSTQQHPVLVHLRPSHAAACESAGKLAVRVPLRMNERVGVRQKGCEARHKLRD